MTKRFYSFGDIGAWDPAPNLTAGARAIQKRYLAMNSQKFGAIPDMPAGDSGKFLVDQQCANTEECQRVITATLEKHGTCYVRISGNPSCPRLVIWEALP